MIQIAQNTFAIARFSWLSLIGFPFFDFIAGFLGGIITAAIYNLVAGWTGGIELRFDQQG